MSVYEFRSTVPQLWFRPALNTYQRPYNAPPLMMNAQLGCVSLTTKMSLANPGQCTWQAEFFAAPTGTKPESIFAGQIPVAGSVSEETSFWFDMIQPADLVGVGFDGKTYFLGMVLEKRRGRAMVGGRVTNTVRISGLALGGIFARQNIMRLFTVKAAGPTTGIWQILMGTVFGRTPDWLRRTQVGQLGQIVIQLLRETMSALSISLPATTPQLLPPNSVLRQYAERGEKLYSYLDYTSGVDPEMNAVYTERLNTLMNFQGSIYDIIREFCPEPWFELWFDVDHTTGTKLVVYFREPPWSSAAWSTVRNPNGLVEDSIKTDEIVSEDIGEDWSNVNTIFWPQFHALPLGNTGLQTQLLPPLISTRLVKMFGLRAYKPDVTWTYPTIDEKETQARPLIARARDLRRKLGLWFGIADHFWSGTVTLKGRTDIRIGHKVRMYADNDNPERQQRAYVTEVTQRWSLTAPWTTTLALTRMTTDTIHKTDEAEVNAMEAEAASVLIDYKGYTD